MERVNSCAGSEFEARRVLLADWQPKRLQWLNDSLGDPEWDVSASISLSQIRQSQEFSKVDVVVMPISWPSHHSGTLQPEIGLDLLDSIKTKDARTQVIVYEDKASQLSISDYCRPFLQGAYAFLDSSANTFIKDIQKCLMRCCGGLKRATSAERESDYRALKSMFELMGMVGESKVMMNVFEQARKAALLSDAPVLIAGESGTGKQLLAEAIHKFDEKRKNHPFITVNCSTISSALAESELFGHRRGAFTGALDARLGYFRAADHGTLFLDEIGELDISLQPKLLRVLESKKILPLGEDTEREVNVRVIAATNRDLRSMILEKRFRLDLFQRLNVFPITLPPLKERKEDLAALIELLTQKHNFHLREIDPRVLEVLSVLDFEGNVRELENLIRRILCTKGATEGGIELNDLPRELLFRATLNKSREEGLEEEMAQYLLRKLVGEGQSLSQIIDGCERIILKTVLREVRGNRERAASMLKTTSRTIFNKIQKHQLC